MVATKLWAATEAIMSVVIPLLTGDMLSATAAFVALSAAMEVNPVVLIITALVALGVGLVMAYNKVKWFRDGVNAVWRWLKNATRDTIGAVIASFQWLERTATSIVNFIVKHWREFILVFGLVGVAVDFVTKHWNWFAAAGKAAWHVISGAASAAWNGVVKPVFNWIVGAAHWVVSMLGKVFGAVAKVIAWPFRWAWQNVIQPIANWIVSAFRWVVREVTNAFNKILGPVKSVVGWLGGAAHNAGGAFHAAAKFAGLQSGGTITRSGMAWVGEHGPELLNLPRGAQVRPLTSGAPRMTGALSTNFTIVVPVSIDRREVARATGKYVDDRLARQ
jgi:phage-related protein